MGNGNTLPPGNEFGQVRKVRSDDENRCHLVSRFCLLSFFYGGRGHHCVYGLPG
jgi:hypothetical protein